MASDSRMVAITTTTMSSIRVKPRDERSAGCDVMVPLRSTALDPADATADGVRWQVEAECPALDGGIAVRVDPVGLEDQELGAGLVGGDEGAAGRIALNTNRILVVVFRKGAQTRGGFALRQEHRVERRTGHGREHV